MNGLPLSSLEHLARPQAGVVSRSQLIGAGWSASSIDRAMRRGALRPVGRGVFRAAGAPWTRRAARYAALLLAGEDATIARWSAAEVHGFAEARTGPITVTVPHDRRKRRGHDELVRVRRSRHLPSEDVTIVDGLRVTTGQRTVLDLCATLSVDRLAEITASCLRVRACDRGQLEAILAAPARPWAPATDPGARAPR